MLFYVGKETSLPVCHPPPPATGWTKQALGARFYRVEVFARREPVETRWSKMPRPTQASSSLHEGRARG
eukprot:scaffold42660_cov45-Phaeocystis_antarctica.AAC.1